MITLSRNHKDGPVIGKGRTGGMGRVTLRGSWTPRDTICVWGVYHHDNGTYEALICRTQFPNAITLQFG